MGNATRAMIERFEAATASGDLAALSRALEEIGAPDFVQEYPQSGERISREATRKITEMYSDATGTSPHMTTRRTLVGDDFFVVEGTIDYGDGVPVSYVGIGDVRDGQVTRMTEYFANPFEAPAWRAGLVERMEATTA